MSVFYMTQTPFENIEYFVTMIEEICNGRKEPDDQFDEAAPEFLFLINQMIPWRDVNSRLLWIFFELARPKGQLRFYKVEEEVRYPKV